MNSIESLQTGEEESWKSLPVDEKIKPVFCLGAASLFSRIFICGGVDTLIMYKLSQEAELEV